MKVAKAKGRLRGKQPAEPPPGGAPGALVHTGEYSTAEVAELFGVARSTVYRAIEANASKPAPVSRATSQKLTAVRGSGCPVSDIQRDTGVLATSVVQGCELVHPRFSTMISATTGRPGQNPLG